MHLQGSFIWVEIFPQYIGVLHDIALWCSRSNITKFKLGVVDSNKNGELSWQNIHASCIADVESLEIQHAWCLEA